MCLAFLVQEIRNFKFECLVACRSSFRHYKLHDTAGQVLSFVARALLNGLAIRIRSKGEM